MADSIFGIGREDTPDAHDFDYIVPDDDTIDTMYNEIMGLIEDDPWADKGNAWQTENAPF